MKFYSRIITALLALLIAFGPAEAYAAQITRQHSDTIVNGLNANATDVSDELNSLVNESNGQDTRLTNIESNNQTISGNKTFAGSTTFSGTAVFSTTSTFSNTASFTNSINLNRTLEPTTPAIGDTWYSATNNAFEGLVNIATVTGATNASPIVVTTSAAHGLTTGQTVYIGSVAGNTAANGSFVATVVSATTFSLGGSTGNGAYTSGGTVSRVETMATTPKTVAPYPTGYHGSAIPVYASAATFTLANIRERSNDDTINLTKTGSSTLTTSASGLSGCTIGSANLTGTVSVTSGSATVTFSSTQAGVLQIGDTITTAGGQVRRLSAGSGTSWTAESTFGSTETTVTVKRGGVGAKNTFYNLYAISDGVTPGLILSTRNVANAETLVDLPSGYSTTTARQLAFSIPLDSSANLVPFRVGFGWPNRPYIQYTSFDSNTGTSTIYRVLNNGTSSTYADVVCSTVVPATSRLAFFIGEGLSGTNNVIYVIEKGQSNDGAYMGGRSASANTNGTGWIGLDTAQTIQYKNTAGASSYIFVNGFVITEVP